ncbi:uncharacterized protein LOC115385492 [Salarias fasciatus]|uniref:uncharacterized protein LOC115385492 n=1 Tax=Salarias fasciatus TaxID=181472 RepID=UPI001176DFE4|nr:uncharacterized protein LOC115385492 [Salarias fasciatus]
MVPRVAAFTARVGPDCMTPARTIISKITTTVDVKPPRTTGAVQLFKFALCASLFVSLERVAPFLHAQTASCRRMEPQGKQVDPESLHERRRRRRCLDVFFTVSIVFLYVAMAAVTGCGVMFVMKSEPSSQKYDLLRETRPQTYQTENFVYLESISGQLDYSSNMLLAAIHSGDGTSVGRNFEFNSKVHSLTPRREGYYFMYVTLNVTCTANCTRGRLSVKVNEKLTCDVDLPSTDQLPSKERSVTQRCWTVTRLGVEKLSAHITPRGLQNWKLESQGSGLGMFLVD